MLICIPDVLSKQDVADFRAIMDAAHWEDGRSTAGAQSALVKNNEQLPPGWRYARGVGRDALYRALTANPLFISAAIPLQIFPPLFNRYGVGHAFRTACRQCDARRSADRAAHSHRPVRHAVSLGARRL